MEQVLVAWLVATAQNYPWILTAVIVMGSLRAVIKPVRDAIFAIVKETKTTADDEIMAKVEASKPWKAFLWVLDYVASIKMTPHPKPAPVEPQAPEQK